MTPTPGRIVIHRGIDSNASKDHPAIVNRAWSEDCANLTVFPDCGVPTSKTSAVRIDPTDATAEGWFWPPRVEG
jgi:hypothetical protein